LAYIYDDSQTYTGEIVNFTSTDKANITSVSVPLTYSQDLHGYANPWPAGGGKNLIVPLDKSFTINGVPCVCSASAETISLKGTATGSGGRTQKMTKDVVLPAGTYTLSVTAASGTSQATYIVNRTDNNTYISSTQFSLAEETSVYVGANVINGTVYDEVVHIQIESGSTATEWTPYENICPISGRTGVNVYRTGKNVAKLGSTVTLSASIKDLADNSVTVYNTSTGAGYKYARLSVLPAQPYEGQTLTFTAKATVVTGTNTPRITCRLYESDYTTAIGSNFFELTGTTFSRSITLPATIPEGAVLCLNLYSDSGVGGANEVNYYDIQLELGSTATTYEPYQGTTYAVDWSTQAGTVYGGTLDVVTGLLTVTHESVNIDDLLFSYDSTNKYFKTEIEDRKVGNFAFFGSSALAISPTSIFGQMPNWSFVGGSSNKNVYIKCFDYTDPTAFKNALSGQTIVYELATPLTYQLTPQEIAALTENYVWTSNGASITVVVSDVLHDFQGWLLKVGSGMTLVPTEMIKAETYKVSPNQRMEETAERDSTGVLWRETVPNMPPKIEFNTPAAYDTDVNALNAIFRAAYSNEQERKLTVAFYDPEENVYKSWECYMPNIDFPIRTIDIDAKTIFYDEIRYAFIGY